MCDSDTSRDGAYMKLALAEARKAAAKGEVPVGAVIVQRGNVVGQGFNQRETRQNPLAHAEILAIEEAASRLGNWRLSECDLYVTLEPCVMCAGAILQARMRRLVFGCLDPKAGAVESLYGLCDDARLNHRLPVAGGILARASADLLESFFKKLRETKKSSNAERWPSPAEGA
ncbi:MAG: tRNA adenosine(34) deaminase TadA [Deltaproteobacteria bacterium]|nr:tRNA adenosine(34) deaminase TadA [Deltaproteobacteria bacterium]